MIFLALTIYCFVFVVFLMPSRIIFFLFTDSGGLNQKSSFSVLEQYMETKECCSATFDLPLKMCKHKNVPTIAQFHTVTLHRMTTLGR